MNNMYFVSDRFQQVGGAIGDTSTSYTVLETAKMAFHQAAAAHYIPENYANLEWACVELEDRYGNKINIENIMHIRED